MRLGRIGFDNVLGHLDGGIEAVRSRPEVVRRGRRLTSAELASELRQGPLTVVDVRFPGERAQGAIPGAVSIPLDQLEERLAEIPRGGRVAVVLPVGAPLVDGGQPARAGRLRRRRRSRGRLRRLERDGKRRLRPVVGDGGLERASQAPWRSSRPGGPGALLGTPTGSWFAPDPDVESAGPIPSRKGARRERERTEEAVGPGGRRGQRLAVHPQRLFRRGDGAPGIRLPRHRHAARRRRLPGGGEHAGRHLHHARRPARARALERSAPTS